MITAAWLAAHITDHQQSAGRSPEYRAQQLDELRQLAALIIAGEV